MTIDPDNNPRYDALRAFFKGGMFIAISGLLLALLQPLDSGEFVISVCSAGIGGVLMIGVALVLRLSR